MNSKGHFGLHAAHILSVEKNGPDRISNGLALTHTAHWMFDNFLLAIDDDYKLLISERGSIPSPYLELIMRSTKGILLPAELEKRPSLKYIRQHREIFRQKNLVKM